MTRKEKIIVQELAHPLYTVTYLETWLTCTDNVDSKDPAALTVMAAQGYYEAVKQRAAVVYTVQEDKKSQERNLRESVIHRINEMMKIQRLSRHEVTRRANISKTTFRAIMEGSTSSPTILTLSRITHGLGVSMREFFDCELFGTNFYNEEGGRKNVSKNN